LSFAWILVTFLIFNSTAKNQLPAAALTKGVTSNPDKGFEASLACESSSKVT
jgi:hypothetical protein